MKHFLLSIIVVFTAFSLWAQDTPQHLKFKNIPITGQMSNMITQLQKVGFTLDYKEDNFAKMKGVFANKDCELVIGTTSKTKQVYMITVIFEKATSWYSLKSDYLELKQQLKDKYGVKPTSKEEFEYPYYEGDGYELSATSNDKCTYGSIYNIDDGNITLLITDKRIALYYVDYTGETINIKENQENTLNDL